MHTRASIQSRGTHYQPCYLPTSTKMAVCWTLAYLLYISGSKEEQIYCGVPPVALLLRLAATFVHVIVGWTDGPTRQRFIHYVLFALQYTLALQFITYERNSLIRGWPWYLLGVTSVLAVLMASVQGYLDAYSQNRLYLPLGLDLVTSILFVQQALHRLPKLESTGTTTWIPGILRLVGTAASATHLLQSTASDDDRKILFLLAGSCLFWDLYYLLLVTPEGGDTKVKGV